MDLRRLICTTALTSTEARKNFAGNDFEWKKTWTKLSNPGEYELEGADLMLAGLAHCLEVNIMTINTPKKLTPFTFAAADVWGGPPSNKAPLLLVYDNSHYETVLAATAEDEQFCAELFNQWRNNDFRISREDIQNAKIAAGAEPQKTMSWADIVKTKSHTQKTSGAAGGKGTSGPSSYFFSHSESLLNQY